MRCFEDSMYRVEGVAFEDVNGRRSAGDRGCKAAGYRHTGVSSMRRTANWGLIVSNENMVEVGRYFLAAHKWQTWKPLLSMDSAERAQL